MNNEHILVPKITKSEDRVKMGIHEIMEFSTEFMKLQEIRTVESWNEFREHLKELFPNQNQQRIALGAIDQNGQIFKLTSIPKSIRKVVTNA